MLLMQTLFAGFGIIIPSWFDIHNQKAKYNLLILNYFKLKLFYVSYKIKVLLCTRNIKPVLYRKDQRMLASLARSILLRSICYRN